MLSKANEEQYVACASSAQLVGVEMSFGEAEWESVAIRVL